MDDILCANIHRNWARVVECMQGSQKSKHFLKKYLSGQANVGRKGQFASLEMILRSPPANRPREERNQWALGHQER